MTLDLSDFPLWG